MNKNIIKPKVSYYMNSHFFRRKITGKNHEGVFKLTRNQTSAKIAMM